MRKTYPERVLEHCVVVVPTDSPWQINKLQLKKIPRWYWVMWNICAQRKYCSGKLIELYPLWINIQVDLSPQWISLKQTISSIPYSYVNYPRDCRFRISKNWYSNDRPFLSPIVSLETESNMCRFKYHFCGLNIHLYKSSTKCCG